MRKLLLIMIGILVAGGFGFMTFRIADNMKYKNDELKECSYSAGGGMLGGYSSVTLKKEKDGRMTLTVREKETHADREKSTVYQADPAAFEKIREIVNRCSLYPASKRPYSKIQVMDGETSSLRFYYAKGSFSISSNQVLSKKMDTGFWEVRDALHSFAKGEGVTALEPQTAMLYLKSGYTLQFTVEDAFDGKLDEILSEEKETARYEESGIILNRAAELDVSGAPEISEGRRGTIVYDRLSGQIIILYEDCVFAEEVYQLAHLDGYLDSACPLIAEMEGDYRLYLN